ncbi:acyltransferase [Leeia sp. TBRC 13508]|uniref:Acyltransferase n=1 Tax=Leeia speluncae TaxID=2884804 RepID=A0ABS8D2F8_9NEIS|nr:DapH/DapD/GlmU-related protein [Leeia speluncae]MCB6182158.1 acyltransferase [Leeia speluncae]
MTKPEPSLSVWHQIVWFALKVVWRLRQRVSNLKWQLLGCKIAQNAQVEPGVNLLAPMSVTLDERAILYRNSQVMTLPGGEFYLGRRSHIAPGAYLLVERQQLWIGHHVAIGPGCSFFCVSNVPVSEGLMVDARVGSDIRVGSNVFIGANCVILPGALIEDNVCVAANSVVKGTLSSGWVYAGSPAKAVKPIGGAERVENVAGL